MQGAKPIMEQKDEQGYNHYKHRETHPKRESQRQINQTERPIRRSFNRVNAPKRAGQNQQHKNNVTLLINCNFPEHNDCLPCKEIFLS